MEFTKGDTNPAGDCGNFSSGITTEAEGQYMAAPREKKTWFNRIECYGNTAAHAEEFRDQVFGSLGREAALTETVALKQRDLIEAQTAVTGWARKYDALEQRLTVAERALGGMLFAFDDGVGREWSAPLLDFARKVTPAVEFKSELKPAEADPIQKLIDENPLAKNEAAQALLNRPKRWSESDAQHQGEPLAWVIQWGSVIPGCIGHREVVLKDPGALDAVITPLYAYQPAPAIKLHLNASNVKVTANADGSYTIDPGEQPAPVSAEAANAFAKGFNTLEQVGGKYKIVMEFSVRDDAWAAYKALGLLERLATEKP